MRMDDFLTQRDLVGHYTKLDTAICGILKTGSIRFHPLARCRDPREQKRWKFDLDDYCPEAERPQLRQRCEEASTVLRDRCKVACFSRHEPVEGRIRGVTDTCFGRPRMWDQYGDQYRGVCLVFTRAELDQSFRRSAQLEMPSFFLGDAEGNDVQYDDHVTRTAGRNSHTLDHTHFAQVGVEMAVSEHLLAFKEHFFFRKHSDWKAECETRWVVRSANPNEEDLPYGAALRCIVIGEEAPSEYLPSLREVAQGVPIRRLVWATYGLEDYEVVDPVKYDG